MPKPYFSEDVDPIIETKAQLHQLLAQAKEEEWTDLYLYGSDYMPTSAAEFHNVFHCKVRAKDLPRKLGNLSLIQKFALVELDIDTLPQDIEQLTNLNWLIISKNQLSHLPDSIGQLTNLRSLSVWDNQLSSLPDCLSQLTNLKLLDVTNNQLRSLPDWIGQLTNLQSLAVVNNQLSNLPKSIVQLTNLLSLELFGNPDLNLPPEVIYGGNAQQIITYYVENVITQSRPLNEVKLLVIGQGGVGKTSIVSALRGEEFNKNTPKTDGIAWHTWHWSINGDEIRINVWDFGGQEIMHATHQFFLSKRSVYLLVLNSREGEELSRLDYWLKMIALHGGNSPIVIAKNHCDQQYMKLNEADLVRNYPQIEAFIDTSAATGEGLDQLAHTIERAIDGLEHVRIPLGKAWFNVKRELEDVNVDFVGHPQYLRLCRKMGIQERQSQDLLLGFLHDLGIVLNFADDPRLRFTSILNPTWATEGVYRLLNDKKIGEDNGRFEYNYLSEVLDPKRYPEYRHLTLLDLMRRFEIVYDLLPEAQPNTYFLLPDLLPPSEPEFHFDIDDALGFQYLYPEILPPSVMTRFIVRANRLIHANILWLNGVMLSDGRNTALVRADTSRHVISLWVGGKRSTRRDFLAALRTEFGHIHATYTNLVIKRFVPIPDAPEYTASYSLLLEALDDGDPFVRIDGYGKVDPRELVDGVGTPQQLAEHITYNVTHNTTIGGDVHGSLHSAGRDVVAKG